MDPQRRRNILLWTGSILLAAMFLMSGSGKLMNGENTGGLTWDEQFVAWGYPAWFRFVVGSAEVLGAVLLLVPLARFYGAAGLTALMTGAVVTHIANGEGPYAAIPLVLGLIAGLIAWATRPAWVVDLLGRARSAKSSPPPAQP